MCDYDREDVINEHKTTDSLDVEINIWSMLLSTCLTGQTTKSPPSSFIHPLITNGQCETATPATNAQLTQTTIIISLEMCNPIRVYS